MCCLVTIFMLLGPRAVLLIWWLSEPNRIDRTFDSILVPVLGVIFAPFTTLVFVAVHPNGVNTIDWAFIIVAALADLSTYAGGGFGNRGRMRMRA